MFFFSFLSFFFSHGLWFGTFSYLSFSIGFVIQHISIQLTSWMLPWLMVLFFSYKVYEENARSQDRDVKKKLVDLNIPKKCVSSTIYGKRHDFPTHGALTRDSLLRMWWHTWRYWCVWMNAKEGFLVQLPCCLSASHVLIRQ